MIRGSITRSMLIRILADAALISAALALAVGLRLMYLIAFELTPNDDIGLYVRRDWVHFLFAWPLVVLTTLGSGWLNGIYTYGKNYMSKYKVLVVARSVSLSFVVFGFLAAFLSNNSDMFISRGAFALAWVLTIAFLAGARVWNDVWNKHVVPERTTLIHQKSSQHRVLVVGGGGYIGSALIPILLESGYKVRMLDLLLFGEHPISSFANHPNLEIVRGDFRHTDLVLSCLQDVESVVHLGAIVGDPACAVNEELTIDVNLVSTQALAHLSRSVGVKRFIFASTCSVYGASDELLNERSMVKPISLYGETKLASEEVLLKMRDERFAPTILRFATIYGFSGRTRFDLVVNLLTAKAKIEGEFSIHGGDQWRPFVHVKDAARSVVAALNAPPSSIDGEIFNVGSNDQNYTILEIGELVAEQVPSARMLVAQEQSDQRNYRVVFDKIHRVLDYVPLYTVVDGIQQVLEAIATGEIADYGDAQYSNFKFLNEKGTGQLAKDQWARQMIQDLSRHE